MDNLIKSKPIKSLLNRISVLLSVPGIEDEAQSRKAQIINRLILVGIFLLIFAMATIRFFYPNPIIPSILLAGLLVILLVMFFLLRSGFIDPVANGIILSTWIAIAISAIFTGGVISPFFISLILIVPVSSLLTSNRAALGYAIANIVTGILLIFFQRNGLLPEISSNSPPEIIFFIVVFISIFGVAFVSERFRTLLLPENFNKESESILQNSIQELEAKTQDLTNTTKLQELELDRFNKYLSTASLIGQETLSLDDPQLILDKSISLIGENLNFYHVGVFLIDMENEWAILRAASSPGGLQMIARDHRLQVGKQGIVGYVTGIGQARISQDIGLDRIHSTTAELPDTRSEMALPLKIRGKIIGALDIQEDKENAFTEKDIEFLQTLANQIAFAIENATLNHQIDQFSDEIQRAYGEYSQQAWSEAMLKGVPPAFRYNPRESLEVSQEQMPSVSFDAAGKKEVPIFVRGQKVGSIDIFREEDKDWTTEESHLLQTLSDQLGVALDSARLFSETQQRAATEHIISEIGSEIRETLEINTILKTAAEKMRNVLDLPQVTIRMAPPQSAPTDNRTPTFEDEEPIGETTDS